MNVAGEKRGFSGFPFHPLLFAVAPFLAMYANNLDKTAFASFLLPALNAVAVTGISFFLSLQAYKSIHKAALLVSAVVICFFSYGFAYDQLRLAFSGVLHLQEKALTLIRHRSLCPALVLALIAGGISLIRVRKNMRFVTGFLNVAAVAVVAINLFHITRHLVMLPHETTNPHATEEIHPFTIGGGHPDIYYITVDEYAGLETVRNYFAYAPDSLERFLSEKGFFVAQQSRSNYHATEFSLGTSMNMDYVHLNRPLLDSQRVAALLRANGYRTLSQLPARNIGDFFLRAIINNELLYHVLSGTMLRMFMFDFIREYEINIFDHFDKIVRTPGPKFVHVHIPCPHSPFVWGPNGERVDSIGWRWEDPGYFNQWLFVTKKLYGIVDAIMAGSAGKPIIIIQSDHGIREMGIFAGEKYSVVCGRAIDDNGKVVEKKSAYFRVAYGILNAFYFPDGNYAELYDSISPVNNFRVVFNHFFGTKFKLLKDESYHPADIEKKSFYNVTRETRFE